MCDHGDPWKVNVVRRWNGGKDWGRNGGETGKRGERESKKSENHEEKAESEAKTYNYACPGVCQSPGLQVSMGVNEYIKHGSGHVKLYFTSSNTLGSCRQAVPLSSPPSTRTKLSEMVPESSSREAERARRMSK